MPPRKRTGITTRQNADGSWSYDIRWRQGGGRDGKRYSHSFKNQKLAADAYARIQAAGWVCHCPRHAPEGATPTKHYGPAPKTKGPTFADYGREHVALRTGIGDGQRHALLRDLDRHMAPFFTELAVDGKKALMWLRGLEDGTHPWLTKPLAPRTRRRLITQAGAILNAAMREGLVTENPFQGIRVGREDHDRHEEQVILTHEEWALLRESITQPVGRGVADLLVGTGARWGEATALQIGHIDRDKGTVRIAQSWQGDGKGGAKMGPTKSRKSRRTVEIGRKTLLALEPFLDGRKPGELLFAAGNGERLRAPNFWRDVWSPAVERAQAKGLAKSPRIHDLRHTHVSWLIAAGVPIAVIQRRLGHESITTTIDTYGHMLPTAEAAAAEAIDNALEG